MRLPADLANTIMGHESATKMMNSLMSQMAQGMIDNAIKSIMADDMTKERDAAKAARKAFNAGIELPFPVNIVAAPTFAAAAFTSVMAFEQGGMVPGMGTAAHGDVVPAMLSPGEAILTKDLTEGLTQRHRAGPWAAVTRMSTSTTRPRITCRRFTRVEYGTCCINTAKSLLTISTPKTKAEPIKGPTTPLPLLIGCLN